MSSSGGLIAQPLRGGAFNWIYLVEWIVNGILLLFFLFYWNRLVSTVLSYLIRLYTWHAFRIYIDIEALQFSPLAGRLFFKGIRYHGDNETIFIHSGSITWRYWIRKVKECAIFGDEEEGSQKEQDVGQEGGHKKHELPCRVAVKITGAEAFLYNRSPAYDAILANLQKKDDIPAQSQQRNATYEAEKHSVREYVEQASASSASSQDQSHGNTWRSHESEGGIELSDMHNGQSRGVSGAVQPAEPSVFLRMLPIRVEVSKGAAVLGNENTKSIITAKFDTAAGEFDAGKAGDLDLFQVMMAFDVEKPYVQMKPNVDYKISQLDEATSLQKESAAENTGHDLFDVINRGNIRQRKRAPAKEWLSKFGQLAHKYGHSTESVAVHGKRTSKSFDGGNVGDPLLGQQRWEGLSRYLDDDRPDEHREWEDVEYAKSSLIADLRGVSLKFFWDIPGTVPDQDHKQLLENAKRIGINGTVPPAYGLSLVVKGGQVNYGPWADRHRVVLQQIFFPAQYSDATPASPLIPGETRISTVFSLDLLIEASTTLRIPFREASKDAKWEGRAGGVNGPKSAAKPRFKSKSKQHKHAAKHKKRDTATTGRDVRPFAWFDITIKEDSKITYEMDMYARSKGYDNQLGVDVSGVEISSSLNHALLWRSGRVVLDCDLSYPLAWNALREWLFKINISGLELFLLRDHTFLLVDLINDWSAGPPPDFFTFVPFRYLLQVHFSDFKLYLNTNDANIIENSEDIDDNEFVILYGDVLDADMVIPLDRYLPASRDITFDVTGVDLGFELCMPSKITLSILLQEKRVAKLDRVTVNGVYNVCMDTRPGLTDTLTMTVDGQHFTISLFGFLARHLIKVKENYFGDTVHFRTLQEYQELVREGQAGPDAESPSANGNPLDVILDIKVADANILLPGGLYDATEHIWLSVDNADIDLRVTSYYLEMMVDSSPIHFGHTSYDDSLGAKMLRKSQTELFLDSLAVFGHRLFGLPPKEPAYVSNFDIDVGNILGECSSRFLQKFAAAAMNLALTIDDDENAIPVPHSEPLHDSTFVRFKCPLIRLWSPVGEGAILLDIRKLGGTFNDLATGLFSQRLVMSVPEITFACTSTSLAASGKKADTPTTETFAYLHTALSFTMIGRALHFQEEKQLQQDYMYIHDKPTQRAQFLLTGVSSSMENDNEPEDEPGPMSLPLPGMPPPMYGNGEELMQAPLSVPLDFAAPSQPTWKDSLLHLGSEANVSDGKAGDARVTSSLDGATDMNNVLLAREVRRSSVKSEVVSPSPFMPPNFLLQSVEPDLSEVPKIPQRTSKESHEQRGPPTPYRSTKNEDSVHTSLVVGLNPGIVAYCTPKALNVIRDLMDFLQPRDPEDILDGLHLNIVHEVLAIHSKRDGKNSILDLKATVPYVHLRLVNEFTDVDDTATNKGSDRYNIITEDLSVLARFKTVPTRGEDDDANMMHATLGSLTFTAQEGSKQRSTDDAAFQIVLEDILVWLIDGQKTSVNVSLRDGEITMASTQVQYLAALIHRTTMLVDNMRVDFKGTNTRAERRLQYLTSKLIARIDDIQSPAFLTRPSYIIRSSPNHIRNSESWKIVSKLRHVLRNLEKHEFDELVTACNGDGVELPESSTTDALATLDHWRDWDTTQAADTVAMRIVYGTTSRVVSLHDRSSVPLSLSVRTERLALIADPGPEQNEFSIQDLAVAVSITPPPPAPTGLQWFEGYRDVKKTTVQIDNGGIALKLNWHLCPLVDRVILLFEKSAPGQQDVDIRPSQAAASASALIEEMHVVFSSDIVAVTVETPHLINVLEVESIKVSVIGSGWTTDSDDVSVNAITSAKAISVGMRSHQGSLWRLEVVNPSLWAAFDQSLVEGELAQSVKLVGDSTKMAFQVDEDIISLIELVDGVIGEEVVYVKRLIDTHAENVGPQAATSPAKSLKATRPVQVHIALFLDHYSMGFTLLEDLHYSLHGRVARLSVVPDAHISSTYVLDFDLKTQVHQVTNELAEHGQTVCEFEMPQVNGSVRILHSEKIVTASGTLTVEKILLDGHAIYGLVSTLTSQRVQSAIEAITSDVKAVRKRLATVLPEIDVAAVPKPVGNPGRPIIFDTNMTFGGLAVSIDAHTVKKSSTAARVLFEVHSFHMRAANRSPVADVPLPSPEIRLVLEQITLDLQSIERNKTRNCGAMTMGVLFTCTLDHNRNKISRRALTLSVFGPNIDIFAETAPLAADIFRHLQKRLKHLDLVGNKKYFRRLRHPDPKHELVVTSSASADGTQSPSSPDGPSQGIATTLAFDLQAIRISYLVRDSVTRSPSHDRENLVLSLKTINLLARSKAEAKISIADLEVALATPRQPAGHRARNSALLPEIVFNVTYKQTKTERKFTFQAAGKSLDIQLEPLFMLPVNDIERSITLSSQKLRAITATLDAAPAAGTPIETQKMFSERELTFLLVSADFAGAVVRIQGQKREDFSRPAIAALNLNHSTPQGRYGQFVDENAESSAVLRAPGFSLRVQYTDPRTNEADLNVELRVDASSNTLQPSVVPLILQISQSVKQLVRDKDGQGDAKPAAPAASKAKSDAGADDTIVAADPRAILGKTRLNVGLRICKQEFALSCQPIAKVAATAKLDDIYITINTVESPDHGNFFAISAVLTGLSVSLRHVYSRDPTLNFEMKSIMLSLMNSKHLKEVSGISAIIKIKPSRAQVNARQIGDVLLFREIWLPPEIRDAAMPAATTSDEPQEYFVARYKELAASTAFPWHATVAVAELAADLDFGQAIGKTSFSIRELWASSNKTTSSQQNLCIGIASVGITSSGRMSGFVGLEKVKVRTSIAWPTTDLQHEGGPLVQASIGFDSLKLKTAFDYQAFAAIEIANFEFVMYNVRDSEKAHGDRLVAILDGDKVHAFITASAAASAVSLYQAFERLMQERQANYEQSLKEIGKFLRRKSSVYRNKDTRKLEALLQKAEGHPTEDLKNSLNLHTDVVVTLRSVVVGAFPTTLSDHQILKAEASDIQARFAATLEDDARIHSGLGLTLGQLSVALSAVPRASIPGHLGDVAVEDIVRNALAAKGGVILKVPRVVAAMQTWQAQDSDAIDYIFRSTFQGKIDIGWNYSRISFIRGMWTTHTRTLASRLGKPLPESAVKIHGGPPAASSHDGDADAAASDGGNGNGKAAAGKPEKITAEVKLPQSRYVYRAMEPPVIETPQLRDMGEATPPLEWVGLHRERLPNLVHQVVIVSLLGVVREVEEAYEKILGSA